MKIEEGRKYEEKQKKYRISAIMYSGFQLSVEQKM